MTSTKLLSNGSQDDNNYYSNYNTVDVYVTEKETVAKY